MNDLRLAARELATHRHELTPGRRELQLKLHYGYNIKQLPRYFEGAVSLMEHC